MSKILHWVRSFVKIFPKPKRPLSLMLPYNNCPKQFQLFISLIDANTKWPQQELSHFPSKAFSCRVESNGFSQVGGQACPGYKKSHVRIHRSLDLVTNFADKYIYFIWNYTVYYFVENVWLILVMRLLIALGDFSTVSLSLFGFIVNDFLPIRFWSSFIAASFSYSWTSSTWLNDIFEPRFCISSWKVCSKISTFLWFSYNWPFHKILHHRHQMTVCLLFFHCRY